ncbi:MAG: serine hydrolase domain-containing protein, partial [Verrucomicrobiota bacterium]
MNWRAFLLCGLATISVLTGCGETARPAAKKVTLEEQNAVMAFALSEQLEEFTGAVTVVVGPDGIVGMEAFGIADTKAMRPMRKDSLFWIASMTKPMTAACVLMLVEEGKVSLDAPVSKYLPAFGEQKLLKDGKQTAPARQITVRDLLTHTSGLTAAYATPADQPSDSLPLDKMCDFYARQPLRYEPGSQWSYNNPGINTLGRIVEVVSGMPYSDFLESRLLEPLGMGSTTFWPDESELARRALPYAKDKASGA